MSIWELTPINSTDPNWRASRYNGPVVIRAPSEKRAREIAVRTFQRPVKREPGETVPNCPWDYEGLVRCRQLEESDHSEDGPEAILDPAEYGRE